MGQLDTSAMVEVKIGDKVRIGSDGAAFVEVLYVEGVFFYYQSSVWSGDARYGRRITQTHKVLRSNIQEVK